MMPIVKSLGIESLIAKYPYEVSGGQKQRVAIARSLITDPKILLADEPTGALDSKTGILILSLLQDMSNTKGTTVVIVTHNAIFAEAADKVIRIKNGQIESIVVKDCPKNIDDLEW